MLFKQIFLPEQSRGFKAKRWLDIILRTIHLLGLLGVAGGVLFNAEQSLWMPYFLVSIISGLAMVFLSLWSNGKWILQNRGLAICFKFILLLLLPIFPDYGLGIFMLVVIISAISSHAPAKFRYYSPILGREI
ncbi:MAG: hypothetical protein QM479_14030 [Pseudomonadota bacterium]